MPTTLPRPQQAGVPLDSIEIPPFPAIAIKALQLISKDYSRLTELSNLICSDAAFSAEMLRIVNSPFFGLRTEVKSVLQATLLLGLERVKGLVVTIGMRAYLGEALKVPALRACWRHSLACAMIAEDLTKKSLEEKDVAYTAGIIHDIGRFGLAVAYPERYASFLARTIDGPAAVLERERELFGINHCEAGRSLVLRWNLPKEFVRVTSEHHQRATDATFDLVAVVRASCMMADALGFEVVLPREPRNYKELLTELPERHRSLLSRDAEELSFRIAEKINSLESA
jgi:putative nucleotidyltransferase with HDIG domain